MASRIAAQVEELEREVKELRLKLEASEPGTETCLAATLAAEMHFVFCSRDKKGGIASRDLGSVISQVGEKQRGA